MNTIKTICGTCVNRINGKCTVNESVYTTVGYEFTGCEGVYYDESDFEIRVNAMETNDTAYELMMFNFDEEEKASHERIRYLEEAYYENRKGELIALDGYNPWSIELDDDMPF